MKEDYYKTIIYEGRHKTLEEWMNIDQFFAEEIGNYFDEDYKAQMESLLLLLNKAYELGKKGE